MNYKHVHVIYFSPTHSSAKIAHAIVEGMGAVSYSESDLTYEMPESEEAVEKELTIVAVPVYGGRVPDTAVKRLQKFVGKESPVVPVVVYGNRDYEDALLELSDLLVQQGFTLLAAAAFVGEHSFSCSQYPVAAGRPDQKDHDDTFLFGQHVLEKLEAYPSLEALPSLKVKGNRPYKEKKAAAPSAPLVDASRCNLCGHCVDICPVGAISIQNGEMISDPVLCIKCCACVKECPEEARTFPNPFAEYLYKNFSARKAPELFL